MKKKRILIVENSLSQRILIGSIVDTLDYDYVAVNNGKEAIDLLMNDSDFNVILMDIEMPVMNGIEAAEFIKNSPSKIKEIPLIALTAHNIEKIENTIKHGFVDHIIKPFDVSEVLQTIKNYII